MRKILEAAKSGGLADSNLEFLGPEYWCELCDRHPNVANRRLDFQIPVTFEKMIDAFKEARYRDNYIGEFKRSIETAQFKIKIKNNRTPLEIEIPFSPELSVENCLDAARELLGISLEWTNYPDLGTSAGPSISLAIDQKAQGFSQKIKDLVFNAEDGLKLWITIIWEDKTREKGRDAEVFYKFSLATAGHFEHMSRDALTYAQRREETISRTEQLIQGMIWKAAEELRQL